MFLLSMKPTSIVIRKAAEGDFQRVLKVYSQGLAETKGFRPILTQGVIDDKIKPILPDLMVADVEGQIVGQMALTFPHRIVYVANDTQLVETEGAFLHFAYTLTDYAGSGLRSRLHQELEANASKNPDITRIHAAAENQETPEWLERMGYRLVGIECRCCDAYPMGVCRRAPMYRKRIK
jgi:GNAT superfamily N-acetyltransferase